MYFWLDSVSSLCCQYRMKSTQQSLDRPIEPHELADFVSVLLGRWADAMNNQQAKEAVQLSMVLGNLADRAVQEPQWASAVIDQLGLKPDADLYHYLSGTFGMMLHIARQGMAQHSDDSEA